MLIIIPNTMFIMKIYIVWVERDVKVSNETFRNCNGKITIKNTHTHTNHAQKPKHAHDTTRHTPNHQTHNIHHTNHTDEPQPHAHTPKPHKPNTHNTTHTTHTTQPITQNIHRYQNIELHKDYDYAEYFREYISQCHSAGWFVEVD